jgi:hypothetical protein
MINVSTVSTNATSVETSQAESASLQSTQSGLTGLGMVKARGQTPSDQDVSHFQQALMRRQEDGALALASLENLENGAGPDTHELSSTSQAGLNGNNVEVKTPVGANPEVADQGNVTAQVSARMRWLERRRLSEEDKDDLNSKSTIDDAVFPSLLTGHMPAPAIRSENAPAPMASAPEMSRFANRLQGQMPATGVQGAMGAVNAQSQMDSTLPASLSAVRLQGQAPATEPVIALDGAMGAENALAPMPATPPASLSAHKLKDPLPGNELHKSMDGAKNIEIDANAAASVWPKAEPVQEVSTATVDTAWASRTVQDTVRATLRTLAQRDLESLDAGRPIQITLDQGLLRGARLTLEANDGLLEISVSTSQAQLRATLEAQQDALTQGLLRDVGAVRWLGLQDVMPLVASNNDTNTASFNSQQSSQGQGSDRQNQSQNPAAEVDEVALSETKSDNGQVIADAQSLRAFLGL